MQFFSHPEGYVTPDGSGGYDYVYQYKDHLGNIRLSYTDSDGNGTIATSEIIEENNYYPFGLKHKGYNSNVSSSGNSTAQKFKYNGKELNEELGLNMYDYGWRLYDPAVARWNGLDPYAEIYEDLSPYNYALNSPITVMDPDGRLVVYVNGFRLDAYKNYFKHVVRSIRGDKIGGNIREPWEHEQRFFNTDVYNYWADFQDNYRIGAKNEQRLYVDGFYTPTSRGGDRFDRGIKEGRILAEKIKSGEITLEDGETIKLVGHSHGGAHAMGMAQGLLDAGIDADLIDVLLFAPHQPNQIKGVKVDVYQFSREGDEVSSTGLKSFLFGNSMFARIPGAKIAQLPDGDDDGLGNHSIQTYTSEELAKNRPDLYLFLVNQGIINADGTLRNNE